ncbi:MAG: PEGA domain-containing protein [Bacteroidaceae bacterium]|nr:PEGA domain-containing protein [Bacteroidaceae bacterium]
MATRKHYYSLLKSFLLASLLCLPSLLLAQNIQVTDFAIDDMDLTANLAESSVTDMNNGGKCALIKIHTTEKGFTFDVGSLGVTKVVPQGGTHPTEIWVYVPAGVKRISVLHPQLGEVSNFDLHQTLKAAKTYNLTLKTGKIETIINPTLEKQWAIFTIVPANAAIEVNGESWEVDEQGRAARQLPFGTYQYRITAPRYRASSGQFTIGKQKYTETVTLTPNFSKIRFEAPAGSEIWIDGLKRGTGTCEIELQAGDYSVECRQESHIPTKKVVTVAANHFRTIPLDHPRPIYGILSVNSKPFGAIVMIDGKMVGETPLSIDTVLIGRREVSVSMNGYYAEPQTIQISQEQPSALEFNMTKGTAPSVNTYANNYTPQQVTVPSINKSEYDRLMKKSKKLRKWCWWGGGALILTGAAIGYAAGESIMEDRLEGMASFAIVGAAAAIPWTLGFGLRSRILKKRANRLYQVNTTTMYEEEFKFDNGTSLTTSVDWLQDNHLKTYTPGFGLKFNF